MISDTKPIHATYLIFVSDVKPQARKIRLFVNVKGKSMQNIHSPEWGYNCDIQKGLGTVIHHSMDGDWNLGFLFQNDDITSFQGDEKTLIRWRYHNF